MTIEDNAFLTDFDLSYPGLEEDLGHLSAI